MYYLLWICGEFEKTSGTIAYSCQLLSSIANYCHLLSSIANYCLLLPTIANYCHILPTIDAIANFYQHSIANLRS